MPTVTAEQLRQAAIQFCQTPHPKRDGIVCDCNPTMVRMPPREARRSVPWPLLLEKVWLSHDTECSYAVWARETGRLT